MLASIRAVLAVLLSVIICFLGLMYCLFSPRDPKNVAIFGRLFGYMSILFGIQVEVRYPKDIVLPKNCIYIANHQSSYDMITASCAVQSRTITVGKKSLLWIPLFGWLYWLSGNLLIDRNKKAQSHYILTEISRRIKALNISLWIFPEGTRSRGRGLLPFKIGAFYAAIVGKVPIVPVCVSNTSSRIHLNRWSNGLVIVEILPPIETSSYNRKQARILAKYCQYIMKKQLDILNLEVTSRDKARH